jgi:hypothetical protein
LFRSRRRDVVFPQHEHARLAGALALVWGNERFPRPLLPFDSFVRGVTLHDRGYDEFDDDPLGGETPEERWLEIQLAGAEPRGGDPVVDLVVALHIRRLIGEPEPHVDAWISQVRAAAGVTDADAAEADRITDLCDSVAFVFCFERPAQGRVEVAGGEVAYTVDGEGGVTLSPWPLAVPELPGLILAYEARGYPDTRVPVVVPFAVTPG